MLRGGNDQELVPLVDFAKTKHMWHLPWCDDGVDAAGQGGVRP